MNTEYSKEEMEQMGKDALKGSQSAYAHVHADGSVYLDHEDEKHKANKSHSVKVDNKALKKAEADGDEELKAKVKKLEDEAEQSAKTHNETVAGLQATIATHETVIESLEAEKKALQEEIEGLKAQPVPEKTKTEEKAADKKGK